jgi:hypothetical protein
LENLTKIKMEEFLLKNLEEFLCTEPSKIQPMILTKKKQTE